MTMERDSLVARDSAAPERIWAKLDRATAYMDGSSPLVARTREFRGSTAYVLARMAGVNGEGSNGEHLERCCPNDPKNDPKNENIDDSLFDLLLSALTDLERYLRDTPHHNSMQAAAARYAINKAGG